MPLSQDTRSALSSCDEDGVYEFPKDFDEEVLEKRARLVLLSIADLGIRVKFEDWVHNQDASFGLAILLEEFQKRDGQLLHIPCLRFSNFGNLVSLTWKEIVPRSVFRDILKVVTDNDFIYVSAEELDCPYDGVMKGDENLPTWWIRYFDWI